MKINLIHILVNVSVPDARISMMNYLLAVVKNFHLLWGELKYPNCYLSLSLKKEQEIICLFLENVC